MCDVSSLTFLSSSVFKCKGMPLNDGKMSFPIAVGVNDSAMVLHKTISCFEFNPSTENLSNVFLAVINSRCFLELSRETL